MTCFDWGSFFSLGLACRISQSAASCTVKGAPVLGQNPASALRTQGISCLHRDYNLIFSLVQNGIIFTGMLGVFPNYPLASIPFFLHESLFNLFACLEAEKPPRRDGVPCTAVLLGCCSAIPVLPEQGKVAITIL